METTKESELLEKSRLKALSPVVQTLDKIWKKEKRGIPIYFLLPDYPECLVAVVELDRAKKMLQERQILHPNFLKLCSTSNHEWEIISVILFLNQVRFCCYLKPDVHMFLVSWKDFHVLSSKPNFFSKKPTSSEARCPNCSKKDPKQKVLVKSLVGVNISKDRYDMPIENFHPKTEIQIEITYAYFCSEDCLKTMFGFMDVGFFNVDKKVEMTQTDDGKFILK